MDFKFKVATIELISKMFQDISANSNSVRHPLVNQGSTMPYCLTWICRLQENLKG